MYTSTRDRRREMEMGCLAASALFPSSVVRVYPRKHALYIQCSRAHVHQIALHEPKARTCICYPYNFVYKYKHQLHATFTELTTIYRGI